MLSASAVDPTHGLMVHEHAEAEMSAAMGGIAERPDRRRRPTKFGRSALVALPPLRSGDIVVTDRRTADVRPARLVVAGVCREHELLWSYRRRTDPRGLREHRPRPRHRPHGHTAFTLDSLRTPAD